MLAAGLNTPRPFSDCSLIATRFRHTIRPTEPNIQALSVSLNHYLRIIIPNNRTIGSESALLHSHSHGLALISNPLLQ